MSSNSTYAHLKPSVHARTESVSGETKDTQTRVPKQNNYAERTIDTATPAKLVEMLYTGALNFLAQAIQAIDDKELEKANEKIMRVEDIIMELNISLDMEKGEEISKNLRALYNYIYKRLLEANIKKDLTVLEECKQHLTDLRDTWVEAMKKEGNLAEKLPDPSRNRIDIAL